MSTADTPDDELPDDELPDADAGTEAATGAEFPGADADEAEFPGADAADDEFTGTDAGTDAATGAGAPPLRASPAPNRSRARGSLVAAAMLGLGQVIEPEKTKVVIEQTDDDPFGGDTDLELTFDRLPPVDDAP